MFKIYIALLNCRAVFAVDRDTNTSNITLRITFPQSFTQTEQKEFSVEIAFVL